MTEAAELANPFAGMPWHRKEEEEWYEKYGSEMFGDLNGLDEKPASDSGKARLRSYIDGPKWGGLRMLLYGAAKLAGVELRIPDEDRGLIRHTLYYEAEGLPDNLAAFQGMVREAAKDRSA